MDYQNRVGSKKGGGGVASQSESNAYRRERVKKLVSNTVDIDNDPYVFKNHVGQLECRLCLTTHSTPESFLSHTQGRKHMMNLQKRALREKNSSNNHNNYNNYNKNNNLSISNAQLKQDDIIRIGKPGYTLKKIRHETSHEVGLLIVIKYDKILPKIEPQFRFMTCYEQKIDSEINDKFQYLIFAADPYDNICFKIPSKEIYNRDGNNGDGVNDGNDNNDDDNGNDKFWSYWDKDTKEFYLQFFYKD